MLTPVFKLNQNEQFVLLQIEAPYVKANEVEIYIEGSEFKFFVKPYFLRLHFPCDLIEDGSEQAEYDITTGIFNIKLPKKNRGEDFPNLDLLTTLLAPKTSNVNKPLIEVVEEQNLEAVDQLQNMNCQDEDSDEELWQFEQELYKPEICLSGYKYGFGNQTSGIFTRLQEEEVAEMIDLPDPENTSPHDRRNMRHKIEDQKFDKDHYIADYLDDDVIQDLMNYKAPWQTELEAILSKHQKLYPETSDLITPKGITKHLQENADCILKPFQSEAEVVLKASTGKRWILRCLLEIYEVLEKDESKHVLNKLYVTDYCVWIQKVKSKKLLSLANQLKCVEVGKNDVELGLTSLEQEAMSAMNALDSKPYSSAESDSEDDSLDSSESSTTDSDDDVENNIRDDVIEKKRCHEQDIEVISTGMEELLSIDKIVKTTQDGVE